MYDKRKKMTEEQKKYWCLQMTLFYMESKNAQMQND